jgi:RNA polymerase sigma factor (sigma-70 family)
VSELTLASMSDARDAEDTRLLEAGEHARLLATYFEIIRGRCAAKCKSREDGEECASRVMLRLLNELKAGRRYRVPFRVVVHMVVKWTVQGFYERRPVQELPLEEVEGDGARDGDLYAAIEAELDAGRLLDGLPPREREVAILCWLRGLEIEDVARELGIERNAVDQALHRARRRLRGMMES